MSNETIKLTAMINSQQYEVSYNIDQVQQIYQRLGLSSDAAQPAPVSVATTASTAASTAQPTASTAAAATATGTGTRIDNTVKKNKVDELNKNIEKLFDFRKEAITEICGKESINDCNIDSDDDTLPNSDDSDSEVTAAAAATAAATAAVMPLNTRADGAPISLNIDDIKAKDIKYHTIEKKIENELENELKNDETKEFIYDIVEKIEDIKDELYKNSNNNLEGYIYKYIQVLTAEEELNTLEQKYKLYYERLNDKQNINKTKDLRKAEITPLNSGIINTYIKLRGLTGEEKYVQGKLRPFKQWQRLDYTSLTSEIENLQDTENIQDKYPNTDKLIEQLKLVSEGIIEYLNIIFDEYKTLADQKQIDDKSFDSWGILRNKLPIPRENKKSGGKKTRKRSRNAHKQTRKQYPKRSK